MAPRQARVVVSPSTTPTAWQWRMWRRRTWSGTPSRNMGRRRGA